MLFSIDQQAITKYIFGNEIFPELSTMLQEDIKIALNNIGYKSTLSQTNNNENISPNINSGSQQHSNNKEITFSDKRPHKTVEHLLSWCNELELNIFEKFCNN